MLHQLRYQIAAICFENVVVQCHPAKYVEH